MREPTKETCLIPLEELHPFENQPFKVLMDESMSELVESVKSRGVLTPITVRPRSEGGYEILSGHRRVKACEVVGLTKITARIVKLNDDMAMIFLVDSNIQRERILPSEKAFAYQMKLEAMKRQGLRTDLTSSQIGTKLRADEQVAKDAKESRNQIHRYIRLTNLIDPLLEMVDNQKLSLNAAVEISYLGSKAQSDLAYIIRRDELRVTIKQALALRGSSQEGKIPFEEMERILLQRDALMKKRDITIKETKIRKYFPSEYSASQIEDVVLTLIKKWASEQSAAHG